eukprot:scaffold11966_cov51-Cyclotella_meneghiniana.AAC.2
MARENNQAMSRVFGRMPTYQGQDQINYGPVNKLARKMFVEMKHLDKNWSVHSDLKNSLYQRIVKCSGVTIPEGWDEYAYFKKVLARGSVFGIMNVEDAENRIDRRMKTLDLLIGNNKTTFTKVLRRTPEELGEGKKVWEEADLRSKMKKNPGVALPLLLDKSDIAYAFEILENCYEVWEQGWYYSPDNKEGANERQKENYAKFKKMKKEQVLYNGRGVAGCKRKSASDDESDEDEGSPRGVIFFSGEEGYKVPCDDYETDDDEEVEDSFERGLNEAVERIAAADREAAAEATTMTGV